MPNPHECLSKEIDSDCPVHFRSKRAKEMKLHSDLSFIGEASQMRGLVARELSEQVIDLPRLHVIGQSRDEQRPQLIVRRARRSVVRGEVGLVDLRRQRSHRGRRMQRWLAVHVVHRLHRDPGRWRLLGLSVVRHHVVHRNRQKPGVAQPNCYLSANSGHRPILSIT